MLYGSYSQLGYEKNLQNNHKVGISIETKITLKSHESYVNIYNAYEYIFLHRRKQNN